MVKFFKIILCFLSVSFIVGAEDSDLRTDLIEQGGNSLHLFCFFILSSVCFLQNQLYTYLLPKKVRNKSIYAKEEHYSKSFFSGTIGLGYIFVALHLFGFYISSNTEYQSEGSLYIGVFFIFCGTLSKIKGIINNELNEEGNAKS